MKRLLACMLAAFFAASAYSSTIIWDFASVDYSDPDDPFIEARADNGCSWGGCALKITINITQGTPGLNDAVALIIADKKGGGGIRDELAKDGGRRRGRL